MHVLPARLLGVVGVADQEFGVRQGLFELGEQVHFASFFCTRTVTAGDAFCRLFSAVALPWASTLAASAGAASAAAASSISTSALSAGIMPLPPVTLAGRLRSSTLIGPL